MEPLRDCTHARPLIPAYQDGELAEDRAAPLRRHLLECQACREVAKAETALKRWFEPRPAVAVPAGFAAHVARRAFAGAVPAGDDLRPVGAEPRLAPAGRAEGTLLPFVLRMTAAAAVVLLVLSFALRRESLPKSDALDATTIQETIEFLHAIESLEEPAAGEAGEARTPAAEAETEPGASPVRRP